MVRGCTCWGVQMLRASSLSRGSGVDAQEFGRWASACEGTDDWEGAQDAWRVGVGAQKPGFSFRRDVRFFLRDCLGKEASPGAVVSATEVAIGGRDAEGPRQRS